MSPATTNGHVPEPMPLKVLIVGAGIAGLTAALALRQEGHECILFEKSELAQEHGAAIHIAPNANGLLRRLGLKPEDIGANYMESFLEFDYKGALQKDISTGGGSTAMWQNPWQLAHRVQLHNELKKLATAKEGKGLPAVLHTSADVVDIDPQKGTVTLKDGEVYTGDLVLGADGVGSVARKKVPGGEKIKPFSSGKSAFRFLVPTQKLLDNPKTRQYVDRPGTLVFWVANDRRIVMYPCSRNTIMNFVCIHPRELSDTKGDDWNQRGSKETLLRIYEEFMPDVHDILNKADVESLKVWPLLDMDQLPTWVNGKLVLLGDSAHPFLPHQGQGGGIAIEDAASLAALLPAGVSRDEIPERLQLYEQCRMERAHKVQEYTRIAGRDLDDSSRAHFDMMEFTLYNFGHDEWHHSKNVLKRHLWAKNPHLYRRMPVVFGPAQGPRQSVWGARYDGDAAKFTRHSVRFKTSATYLKTLFPTKSFSFINPGTVAEASFENNTIDKMGWLGGGGYSFLGLWIHGVQYTKQDGTKLFGSFLPILFESLSDPITTGREELGMPKMFAEIEIFRRAKSSRIKASWRGATFGTLELEDLEEIDAVPQTNANPNAVPDDGQFIYKYIPATGKPGVADVEYPVFVSRHKSVTKQIPRRRWRAKNAKVAFEGLSWDALPTLHHVASGLAEVPVYEVIKAEIIEGDGVEDLRQTERIE